MNGITITAQDVYTYDEWLEAVEDLISLGYFENCYDYFNSVDFFDTHAERLWNKGYFPDRAATIIIRLLDIKTLMPY